MLLLRDVIHALAISFDFQASQVLSFGRCNFDHSSPTSLRSKDQIFLIDLKSSLFQSCIFDGIREMMRFFQSSQANMLSPQRLRTKSFVRRLLFFASERDEPDLQKA